MKIEKSDSIFLPLLQILFIGLKLTGFINWSWFWVLSPILIPLGIAAFIGLAILIVMFIKEWNSKT